jgi:serine/threonine-protein kinase HipA
MITKLNVWLTRPAGEVLKAGELAVKDPDDRGALQGQFRYSQEYLQSVEAFSLDPMHLPLSAGIFDADRPHSGVHGVFEDSLPDDWGRKLMIRHHRLGRDDQRVPNLLRLLGHQGMGALTYEEKGNPVQSYTGIPCHHLTTLALQAEKFEEDPAALADDELALLFQAGSSPGGARPKALVTDEKGAYLAKFASTKDHLDVVGLEAATMKLASRSGLETAETSLRHFGNRKCLLVKRFDVNPSGGRNHLISMQSLLKADGYYYAGYRDMANVIRHVSASPKSDLHMLYKQMIFNVMIGNTDDHLKNFCMLCNENGWRLSPAFDLTPNIGANKEHVLRIGTDNGTPNLETILAEARSFGIKHRQQASDIFTEVYDGVTGWASIFAECQVPEKDTTTIGNDIKQRIMKCSSR